MCANLMQRLTLEKIGELAGVSRATVSRVINHHPNISSEVRERVERIIAETGYQPNQAARSLASNQSNVIGLVIPNVVQAVFTDPYYPRLTQGISAACNQLDYTLALFLFHSPEEEQFAVRRFSNNSLIDGLIITADNHINPFIPQLVKRNVPFVYIGRPETTESVTYIDVDHIGGSYIGTKHLIDLGFKRIAQLSTKHNTAGVDRDKGFRQAMAEVGYAVDEDYVVYGDFTERSGYEAMQHLIPLRPDAVFIQSDTMALGAMRALRDAGLSVPDDMAIVSFDDLPPALLTEPHLTTVRQPVHDVGMLAVETLIERCANPGQPPKHVVLPTELVIRGTCGAAN
ncbi:MAG: LacI family transcriptional regulator [Anaerolineaceae bacterium]|nr:LacI family transcriptional regulator [Anaerolineaceae bacterium]